MEEYTLVNRFTEGYRTEACEIEGDVVFGDREFGVEEERI
jgi:hypothetical protein